MIYGVLGSEHFQNMGDIHSTVLPSCASTEAAALLLMICLLCLYFVTFLASVVLCKGKVNTELIVLSVLLQLLYKSYCAWGHFTTGFTPLVSQMLYTNHFKIWLDQDYCPVNCCCKQMILLGSFQKDFREKHLWAMNWYLCFTGLTYLYSFMTFAPVKKTDFSTQENKVHRHLNAWKRS